jgi:sugar lactone lactonase YvrE
MRRFVLSVVLSLAMAGSLLVSTPASAISAPDTGLFPARIALPAGWRPEGIAIDDVSFFVGSLANGAILQGDLVTGRTRILVPGTAGTMKTGLEIDSRDRIWAAGATGGTGTVYDSRTGAQLAQYQFVPPGTTTFVNDAVATRDAVYFTDSARPFLYVVPLGPGGRLPDASAVRALPLSGGAADAGANNNGIEVTPQGHLLVVQTVTGRLFDVDPGTGASVQVDLGGASLLNGDGMIRRGRTLYVVQNRLNQVAVVQFDPAFTSGTVVRTITDPALDVPSTAALFGPFLYAVNARFTTPPTPTTAYDVIRLRA